VGPNDTFDDPIYRAKHTPVALSKTLSVKLFLDAYSKGIFPWDKVGNIFTWWSPCPRAILNPKDFHVSRSLKKWIRTHQFDVTVDSCFEKVIQQCAATTLKRPQTWISPEYINVYKQLHKLGYAHSVEVWIDNKLAGGIFGLALASIFHGESMFSESSNASKIAMLSLCEIMIVKQIHTLDCQLMHSHLASLGVKSIERGCFIQLVKLNSKLQFTAERWDINEFGLEFSRKNSGSRKI